jgi:hypothetical protein
VSADDAGPRLENAVVPPDQLHLQDGPLARPVAALEFKVAAHADRAGVGDASGATSASVWWATGGHVALVHARQTAT